MRVLELVPGSHEWKLFRTTHIGASDAAKILGVDPWCSAHLLWERKLGLAEEQPDNPAMKRGREMESRALDVFEQKTGYMMKPIVVQHKDYDWMIASLDGLSSCQKYAVEIKCAGKADHSLTLEGKVPDHYLPQLMHQIEVTGLDMIYYFSFDGEEGVIIQVERDQKFIDKMLEKELEFWECLRTFTPPELSDRDYVQRNDSEFEYLIEYWKASKMALKQSEELEKNYREQVIKACQGKSTMGFGVKVQKGKRKGNVDYNAVEELKGVDLEKYRKPSSETWRLLEQ